MLVFTEEEKLIKHLKTQDLETNGVGMGEIGRTLLDGYLTGPYIIQGYLYDKETLSFPVGERFRLDIKWGNKSDAKDCIRRIREAIGDFS